MWQFSRSYLSQKITKTAAYKVLEHASSNLFIIELIRNNQILQINLELFPVDESSSTVTNCHVEKLPITGLGN